MVLMQRWFGYHARRQRVLTCSRKNPDCRASIRCPYSEGNAGGQAAGEAPRPTQFPSPARAPPGFAPQWHADVITDITTRTWPGEQQVTKAGTWRGNGDTHVGNAACHARGACGLEVRVPQICNDRAKCSSVKRRLGNKRAGHLNTCNTLQDLVVATRSLSTSNQHGT